MNKLTNDIRAIKIEVEGLVQGVGFRPFVYRLARQNNCKGYVLNKTDGVLIKIEGIRKNTENFSNELKTRHPAAALIENIHIENDKFENLDDFKILDSQDLSDEISQISPDIAVCDDCIADLKNQPHRLDYPFINCTNCGPRFTIVKDFPYDREKTTMQVFQMCDKCQKEYNNVSDRRFHAQPVACNDCGPEYQLYLKDDAVKDFKEILDVLVKYIDEGKIVAVKGMGGFHLMCDALNEDAVRRLRNSKHREGKPFAVMFSGIDKIKEYAVVSGAEENSLSSWHRPIVLLNAKKELALAFATDSILLELFYLTCLYITCFLKRAKYRQLFLPAEIFMKNP